MSRPPHPGAQPAPFVFPFAEAAAAQAAAEDLADGLSRLRDTHETAWDHVTSGTFEGRTARGLGDRLVELLGRVDEHADALRRQADTLADDLASARQRQRDATAAREAWARAYDAWADWRPPQTTGPR